MTSTPIGRKVNPVSSTLSFYGYEDEIDLRELVQTLWQYRRRIVGLSLGLAMLALVVSLLMPKKYQATAYIRIREPLVTDVSTELDFSLKLEAPPLQVVQVLAANPEILQTLAEHPEVQRMFALEEDFSWRTLKKHVRVSLQKDGHLIELTFTDTEPERTAQMANLWAQILIETLERQYGLAPVENLLQANTENLKRVYEEAQQAYEHALAQNASPSLEAQLERLRSDLQCVWARVSDIPRLRKQVERLTQRVERVTDDTISWLLMSEIMALQSRVAGLSICSTPSLGVPMLFPGETMNRAEALKVLDDFASALDLQETRLRDEQKRLEGEISDLYLRLEQENEKLRLVRADRDKAWQMYRALDLLKSEAHLLRVGQVNFVAEVVSAAPVPDEPVWPRPVLNTLLGGVIGGFIGVLWAFLPSLWADEKRHSPEGRAV